MNFDSYQTQDSTCFDGSTGHPRSAYFAHAPALTVSPPQPYSQALPGDLKQYLIIDDNGRSVQQNTDDTGQGPSYSTYPWVRVNRPEEATAASHEYGTQSPVQSDTEDEEEYPQSKRHRGPQAADITANLTYQTTVGDTQSSMAPQSTSRFSQLDPAQEAAISIILEYFGSTDPSRQFTKGEQHTLWEAGIAVKTSEEAHRFNQSAKKTSDLLTKAEERVKELEKRAKEADGFEDAMNRINGGLESTNEGLTAETESLKRQIRDLLESQEIAEKRVKSLEQKVKELESSDNALKQFDRGLEDTNEGLTAEIESLKRQNRDLLESNKDLLKSQVVSGAQIWGLIKENTELKTQADMNTAYRESKEAYEKRIQQLLDAKNHKISCMRGREMDLCRQSKARGTTATGMSGENDSEQGPQDQAPFKIFGLGGHRPNIGTRLFA